MIDTHFLLSDMIVLLKTSDLRPLLSNLEDLRCYCSLD